MGKQSKIRWTHNDKIEFAKMRKSHNAKISRLEKEKPELAEFLPAKIYMKDVQTRKDFEKTKQLAKMFTKRGSEKITEINKIEVPEFYKKQAKRMLEHDNRRKAQQRKQLSNEKGTNTKANKIVTTRGKLETAKTKEGLLKKVENLKNKFFDAGISASNEAYKQNYLEAVTQYLDPFGKPIVHLLSNVDSATMVKYGLGNMKLSLSYLYDSQSRETKAYDVYNEWIYVLDLKAVDFEDALAEIEYLEE